MKTNSSGMIERIFDANLLSLIDKFNDNTQYQRLDSTHINSNMKQGTRLGLLVTTITKFLKALSHVDNEAFDGIPLEPQAKHTDGNSNPADHFADKNSGRARKPLPKAAKDMCQLVVRFESEENVAGLEEHKLTARVFGEQRVVKEPASWSDLEPTVAVKDPKEVGRDSARRPSDPDAGYSGHKGIGPSGPDLRTVRP
jgi:hypothetical protein